MLRLALSLLVLGFVHSKCNNKAVNYINKKCGDVDDICANKGKDLDKKCTSAYNHVNNKCGGLCHKKESTGGEWSDANEKKGAVRPLPGVVNSDMPLEIKAQSGKVVLLHLYRVQGSGANEQMIRVGTLELDPNSELYRIAGCSIILNDDYHNILPSGQAEVDFKFFLRNERWEVLLNDQVIGVTDSTDKDCKIDENNFIVNSVAVDSRLDSATVQIMLGHESD